MIVKTYIALLRGINVSGQKKVPMAELRGMLTKIGLYDVHTYIQSGNVIFKSSESAEKLEDEIYNAIKSHFRFEVSTIVKTRNELETIFNNCPFPKDKKENSYFIMLSKIPDEEFLKNVESISYENEEVVIIKDALYFHSSAGYGNAKFNMNMYERKLKVSATARNYKTIVKLLSLSEDKK